MKKPLRCAWLSAICGSVGTVAHAQFTAPLPPVEMPAEVGNMGSKIRPSTSFGFAPYTAIQTGRSLTIQNQTYGTRRTDNGLMITAEHRFWSNDNGRALALGGWYWQNGGSRDLYALEARYDLDARFAVQIITSATTHGGPRDFYGFGLVNLLAPKPGQPVLLQIGVGPYFPGDEHLTGPGGTVRVDNRTGYTGLIRGSRPVGNNLNIDASLWYLNYAGQARIVGGTGTETAARVRLSRFAAGVSYRY